MDYTILKLLIMLIVDVIVGFSVYKEIKALIAIKKMPEIISVEGKPVITNSIILTVLSVITILMSLVFWNSYLFFAFLLISCLIGIENCFFIDEELHNIIGK